MTVQSTLSWLMQPRFFAAASPEPLPTRESGPRPEVVPGRGGGKPGLPRWGLGLAVLGGLALGVGINASRQPAAIQETATTTSIPTVAAEVRDFRRSIRIGGTVGASNFAVIRAPRMRGSRDRGGGGGGLTIQSLAEPGSIVQAGDVVAAFESKRTEDQLDTFASTLAQTRSTAGTRKAEMLIATETLRQTYRTTRSEAEKAELDLLTAEVRSAIQAEIFDLLAQEGRASSTQLEDEVRLQEIADQAESKSLEITIQQDQKRLDRTLGDLEKMKIRTPVGGLVVIETMFTRGGFQQASAGDEVYGGAPFMRVVDLSNMAVYANLNQADSQMVKMGSPVIVKLDAYPDAEFRGRVRSLGAMAVSGSGGSGRRGPPGSQGSRAEWLKQVPVEVEILQDDGRIQPDLSASADVLIEELADVLVIPRSSLAESDGASVVWVEQDGRLVQRDVEIGSMSDTEAVVLSGLNPGDLIARQPLAPETEIAMR